MNNLTKVLGNSPVFRFSTVDNNIWFSGFELTNQISTDPTQDMIGLDILGGTGNFHLENNLINAGDVEASISANPGSSIGVHAASLDGFFAINNTIDAGNGGNGDAGANGIAGTGGGNASGQTKGTNSADASLNGGRGGDGNSAGSNAAAGTAGGSIGDPGTSAGFNATQHGAHADNIVSGSGLLLTNRLSPANGVAGDNGDKGAGGGGAGGTANTVICFPQPFPLPDLCIPDPGKPGGGGGAGGTGGQGGSGGGASIGIVVVDTTTSEIANNNISSGIGGQAGDAGTGNIGGAKGDRASLNSQQGGDGSKGGDGGDGSGGGGGPSIGVYIGPDMAPDLTNNTIETGTGGVGGGSRDGRSGDGGWSVAVFDYDIEDGLLPSVSTNNTLTPGTAGEPGPITGSGTAGDSGTESGVNF